MAEFGLLGRKLGHSWSPEIHAELGSTPYGLYEVEPEGVEAFLKNTSLTAMNVTIPYKKDVIPFCSNLSDTAKKLGSVNTLVRHEDDWHGDNTDYYGFTYMLQSAGICVVGRKCLVLGSGGASLTVCAALKDLQAKDVIVISRTGENNYENLHLHADASVIVNTTPVGMYPNNGASPLSLKQFPNCEGVLDLIYNPQKTALLLEAEELKIPNTGGLTMLVAQAKRASELFTNRTLDDATIPAITAKLQKKMQNLVLIGMPGCGKTTVSTLLAEELGMPLFDADAEIEKFAGKTIPEIFAADGEAGFRKIETEVLTELGKKTGIILSTGGGCVTREENFSHLHQNGFIVWLKRDIASLPTEGRPLSQTNKLEEMYKVREPMYRRFAHIAVDNSRTVEETVRAIKEAFL